MKARIVLLCLLSWATQAALVAGKYKAKDIEVRPAGEYPAHQDFQNVVIAAECYTTQEEILQVFDAKKLYEKEIMPVLVVVENRNEFALRIDGRAIYMVDENGASTPALDPVDVLLSITLKKPLSSYSTKREILLQRSVEPKMFSDFQRKVFDEKLIPPHGSDFGVIFFRLPENGDLAGKRLYLPEVENLTEGEELMFFEFDLKRLQ